MNVVRFFLYFSFLFICSVYSADKQPPSLEDLHAFNALSLGNRILGFVDSKAEQQGFAFTKKEKVRIVQAYRFFIKKRTKDYQLEILMGMDLQPVYNVFEKLKKGRKE